MKCACGEGDDQMKQRFKYMSLYCAKLETLLFQLEPNSFHQFRILAIFFIGISHLHESRGR